MFQLCRHILANNHQCAQPAVNGRLFCRHHRGVNAWKRHSGHSSQSAPSQTYDHGTMLVPEPKVYPPLELEFPEDRASIQINIFRIASYLARGLMDRSTATALMYGMQVAQTNLGKTPLLETSGAATSGSKSRSRSHTNDSGDFTDPETGTTYTDAGSGGSHRVSRPVTRVILTPDGDEIAPPVEILEDNEAEPIHHKGCPCLLCAEKYRYQPPEEHHPNCQCGLCEEQEPGCREQESEPNHPISEPATHSNGCHPERSEAESRDLLLTESASFGLPISSLAQQGPGKERGNRGPRRQVLVDGVIFSPAYQVGPEDHTALPQAGAEPTDAATYALPRKRIARASALLSGSTSRDPLNRPWSVAEYTFGDAIRRHEAQYAARAAAALAVGIEPPPYQPYITGLLRPGTPEWEEEQQMQQHSSEYWAEHFRKQIAERPDIQQFLDEENERGTAADADLQSPSS